MKVSYRYLLNHIDLDGVSPKEIADKLTFAGAEVEEISPLASGTNLVIGEILSCIPHPDSDHLHILQVDEGAKNGVHQIVCGAPNARTGLKVIVARNGAKLPGGEIRPSKIRGVDSDGMCCSLLELGVNKKFLTEQQTSGIEELPVDAPIGEEDVLGYLHLDDVAIDLDVLPNRPDLYSFENVAKEVACLFDKDTRFQKIDPLESSPIHFVCGSETPKCQIFTGRIYKNVSVSKSPCELKELLAVAGIRSINNIVDLGNYIMLLTGQPLNMYDADKLPKNELIVRDDFEGDFVAMDGNTYHLEKGDLVVTSDGEPMCLAGIMTADACRVSETTKNIVVEAAYFDYASIRRTSNRLGLFSDSSSRFCKGVNPDQMEEVQDKTGSAMKRFVGAEHCYIANSYDTFPHAVKTIPLSFNYINDRLGTNFSQELILNTLRRDHFEILESDETSFVVKVPSYRIDIDGKADLSEEIIRILGYSNVQSVLPRTKLALNGLTDHQEKERQIRRFLLANGLDQILSYTLVSSEENQKFTYLNRAKPYVLKNPMTVDHAEVRTNLIHSVLKTASYNAARQNKDLALFEISDIDAIGYAGKMLSVVLTGNEKNQEGIAERPYDFYDAKGIFENLMAILGITKNRYSVRKWSFSDKEMHPGRSAEVYIGKKLIGFFGELHPVALKEYGLKNASVLALDLASAFEVRVGNVKASIPSRFPSVFRDLAFVVDEGIPYEDLRKEALKSSTLIKNVEVFDVYRGAGVDDGKKSMALSITFSKEDATLKDEEVNDAFQKVIASLRTKFKAEIRE